MKKPFPMVIKTVSLCLFAVCVSFSAYGQTNRAGKDRYTIFDDKFPAGTEWSGNEERTIRKGGFTRNSEKYIYSGYNDSLRLTGLSLPIRENPGPGEYRYITFAWVKWGGQQIGLQLDVQTSSRFPNHAGQKYGYTYYAGEREMVERRGEMVYPDGFYVENGLAVSDRKPGNWVVVTRDLWKDFGDFTLTGLTFLCPDRRDAGFDAIFLGRTDDVFDFSPGVLPEEVASVVDVVDDDTIYFEEDELEFSVPDKVQIDWAAQVRAGGFMMYPLYLLGLVALIIAVQRWITSGENRFAPRKLRREVHEYLTVGDIDGAIAACEKYPSTLSESLKFILKHRSAGREVVSQTAGDIAARDIRAHLSKIYPLSVISSLSPLLGLLGTIVGMIEAFGLVALYGDEGGASILSDSISKALITTAAGLIIAAPCVAVYFLIKNRIMRLASVIEVEIENVLTDLYLTDDTQSAATAKTKVKP